MIKTLHLLPWNMKTREQNNERITQLNIEHDSKRYHNVADPQSLCPKDVGELHYEIELDYRT